MQCREYYNAREYSKKKKKKKTGKKNLQYVNVILIKRI